jgi:hypothetical protein
VRQSGTWEILFQQCDSREHCPVLQCAETVANTASILNDQQLAKKYRALADSIRLAYMLPFFIPANTYGNGSQTEDILPLALNIAPLEKRDK